MSEHTKEPWGVSSECSTIIKQFDFMGESNLIIGSASGGSTSGPHFPEDPVANARRIVACVNACEGISTEYLEKFSATTFNDFKRMKEQRDELLTALEEVLERMDRPPDRNCSCHLSPPCGDCVAFSGVRESIELAEAAVAKVQK